MSRPLKAVDLLPPYNDVMLWLRLDHDDVWRFHSWEALNGVKLPPAAPVTTHSIGFRSPRDAVHFFTRVLTEPSEVVPEPARLAPGRMEPSPAVEYYWPPTLADAIANHQRDVNSDVNDQIPIERVFVLGAGFSAAFGYATARDIVTGMLKWNEDYCQTSWFTRSCSQVTTHLDQCFPDWRHNSPSLYEFLDTFFPPPNELTKAAFTRSSDPFALGALGVSWEDNNYETWFESAQSFPADDGNVLPAFEGLLGVYLLAGLKSGDVLSPWARSFAKTLRPSDVIITFNWDVVIEGLMITEGTSFCRYDWTPSCLKLIKLHGSADLLGTPNRLMHADLAYNPERFECITEYLWRARTSESALARTEPVPFGRALWPSERYNKAAMLIMPPHYPIGYGFQLIQFNWRKAKTALERAREIHIIGYSLPEADVAFHKLVGSLRSLWSADVTIDVWNPDPAVGSRARDLFGDQVVFHRALASQFEFRTATALGYHASNRGEDS